MRDYGSLYPGLAVAVSGIDLLSIAAAALADDTVLQLP